MKKEFPPLKYINGTSRMHKFMTAFTLAEVLITLGLIGIVAALTMPSLRAKHQEKQTITALKKVYSSLSNAYMLAVNEYGTADTWDLVGEYSGEGAMNVFNKLLPNLKTQKICGLEEGCFSNKYMHLNGNDTAGNLNIGGYRANAILADGAAISITPWIADCSLFTDTDTSLKNSCGEIYVDVNGLKGPNQLGVDTFQFAFTKNKIVPRGTADAENLAGEENNKFSVSCKDRSTDAGYACAGWVIFNENMDYLHCSDLSWDSKTKCK